MKVRLKLFFNWGITFDENNPYAVEEYANRIVQYASRKQLEDAVKAKYPHLAAKAQQKVKAKAKDLAGGSTEQAHSQTNEPQGNPLKGRVADARKTTQTRSTPPGVKPSNTSEVKPNEST